MPKNSADPMAGTDPKTVYTLPYTMTVNPANKSDAINIAITSNRANSVLFIYLLIHSIYTFIN